MRLPFFPRLSVNSIFTNVDFRASANPLLMLGASMHSSFIGLTSNIFVGRFVTSVYTVMRWRFVHPLNDLSPIEVTVLGIANSPVIPLQPENAPSPIDVTPSVSRLRQP